MAEPFIGEIRLFAFAFPPQDWSYCDGAAILISQNPALHAVIGNTYGAPDNRSFNLPRMLDQGPGGVGPIVASAPIGAGVGKGLTPRALGAVKGDVTVTLSVNQVAAHQHAVTAYLTARPENSPSPNFGLSGTRGQYDFSKKDIDPWIVQTGFNINAVSPKLGNSEGLADPHENRQPFLSLNFCIALSGVFPSRP